MNASGSYGARIYVDIDSTNEKFQEVVDYLNEASVWGACDKRAYKYPSDDMRRWEEDNACIRSWEFDPWDMASIIPKLIEFGFTENLDTTLYTFHH
jgi:hypothetical protein